MSTEAQVINPYVDSACVVEQPVPSIDTALVSQFRANLILATLEPTPEPSGNPTERKVIMSTAFDSTSEYIETSEGPKLLSDVVLTELEVGRQIAIRSGIPEGSISATILTKAQSPWQFTEYRLKQDTELSIAGQTRTVYKNSLVIPYPIPYPVCEGAELAPASVAILEDSDGEEGKFTITQEVYPLSGDPSKAIVIPTVYVNEEDGSVKKYIMEHTGYDSSANGLRQPRLVPVKAASTTAVDTRVRGFEAPFNVVNTVPKGTMVEVLGQPESALINNGNYLLPLVVTPSGEVARIASTLLEEIEINIESPVQEVAMAPEAFLANYQWQSGDVVTLTRTGRGTPDNVKEYWTLDISRGNTTYNDLPVSELEYGGYVRPLGVEEHLEYGFPTYIIEGIYLGQDTSIEEISGSQREVQGLILALPSRDGTNTTVVRVISPRDHLPGFSIGGGTVSLTPSQEVFEQISNVIKPGTQIKIDVSQTTDLAKIASDWKDWKGVDCTVDPACFTRVYAFDPKNSTAPEVIYKWWLGNSLDEDQVLRQEDGTIRVGALTQAIIARPLGTVYTS